MKQEDVKTDWQDYADFACQVYVFNEIASSGKPPKSLQNIKDQLKLIQEEVQEIQDGLNENNPKEVLDGAVDTLYTTVGLLQILEELGFNVSKGMLDTAWNNMQKYPSEEAIAKETVELYKKQGIKTIANYNSRFMLWAVMDSNAKVRKPVGFIPNDLSGCVPLQYKGGF